MAEAQMINGGLAGRADGEATARRDHVGAPPVLSDAVFAVENMNCGGCMRSIERALGDVGGVVSARCNLSSKRVNVLFDGGKTSVDALTTALGQAGYKAGQFFETERDQPFRRDKDSLRRLGVAGFAAANVMLLSLAVWTGAASDMSPAIQSLFHWLSALIALPAVAYAGQPFFSSALTALKARRLNMDVPISLGVLLAAGMSLFQTMRGSEQVYFDASVTLLFFLLIGRFLDQRMRQRAQGAAQNLIGLMASSARIVAPDGQVHVIAARSVTAGMQVLVAAGDSIPADGKVVSGRSDIDEGLITGESAPRAIAAGDTVYAGTINISAPLTIEADAAGQSTLLAGIGRLMDAAEQAKGRYVRLADRAAAIYAPAVHLLALVTFIGWMALGAGWEAALTAAIAVLIITCPCALALAVPAVQIAASSRLFANGTILKSADALERLAEADAVVFDKTGTLTTGMPLLADAELVDMDVLARAAALAAVSRHPYAKAISAAAAVRGLTPAAADGVDEIPGCGLVRKNNDGEEKLGSAEFAGAGGSKAGQEASLWYSAPGRAAYPFHFQDELRRDAGEVIGQLKRAGYHVELLSGDRRGAVEHAAEVVGIGEWRAGLKPGDKIDRLKELAVEGRKVVMVGDGLNDAPALAAGHASLSPSTAAEISQSASDAIFQGACLKPVVETLAVATAARRMSFQNFAIAVGYNTIFVPLAMAGIVTPLIAALAMSASSIAVTANAVRLRAKKLELAKP